MARTDVMEHVGDGPADPISEALGRVGMGRAAQIFAARVADMSCGAEAWSIDANDFHLSSLM